MRAVGIIAEYNPIHNGHVFHIEQSKLKSMADVCVCIMSGDFVQRGEPAIIDKWTRAKMAIDSGADLVVELPFFYASNSAKYFAQGGIEILKGIGGIDFLSFGSESGDIEELTSAANFINDNNTVYTDELKANLKLGMSFPRARQNAASQYSSILGTPNNILAIEYISQILIQKYNVCPITVKRKGGDYNDTQISGDISSASAIRKCIFDGNIEDIKNSVQKSTYNDIISMGKSEKLASVNNQKYFDLIKYNLLKMKKDEMEEIFSVNEGIENVIINNIRYCNNIEELASSMKSKRYTRTRINRILLHSLIGLKKAYKQKPYAHILGGNSEGYKFLKYVKKNKLNSIPIISNANRYDKELLEMDIVASDIYNTCFGYDTYNNFDLVKAPFFMK